MRGGIESIESVEVYLAAALRLNRSVVVDLICAAMVAAVRRLKGRPTEASAGDSQRPKERLSRAHDHVVACDLNMTRMMPIWRHQPRKEAVQCPAAQNGGAESGETAARLLLGRALTRPVVQIERLCNSTTRVRSRQKQKMAEATFFLLLESHPT